MTHIDFAILNSHVTVIYSRFIKSTIFFLWYLSLYVRCAFFQARKMLVNWFVRKSYIWKSVKRIMAWPIFLVYQVRSECHYVLSNLALGYTRSTLLCLIVKGVRLQILWKALKFIDLKTTPHFKKSW